MPGLASVVGQRRKLVLRGRHVEEAIRLLRRPALRHHPDSTGGHAGNEPHRNDLELVHGDGDVDLARARGRGLRLYPHACGGGQHARRRRRRRHAFQPVHHRQRIGGGRGDADRAWLRHGRNRQLFRRIGGRRDHNLRRLHDQRSNGRRVPDLSFGRCHVIGHGRRRERGGAALQELRRPDGSDDQHVHRHRRGHGERIVFGRINDRPSEGGNRRRERRQPRGWWVRRRRVWVRWLRPWWRGAGKPSPDVEPRGVGRISPRQSPIRRPVSMAAKPVPTRGGREQRPGSDWIYVRHPRKACRVRGVHEPLFGLRSSASPVVGPRGQHGMDGERHEPIGRLHARHRVRRHLRQGVRRAKSNLDRSRPLRHALHGRGDVRVLVPAPRDGVRHHRAARVL